MMGSKDRVFVPLVNVSLEQLVPADHFYRRLHKSLDLSFVRELVAPFYAAGGRPSVDPIVFFKLQLIMFFEGIRSERQLVLTDAGRKSAIVRKLTSDLKKRTQRTQIDGKKADALHKKCDCAGMPNRYN